MSIEYVDAPFLIAKIKGSVAEQHKAAVDWADTWLQYKMKQGANGALIFDIDETVITLEETEIKPMCALFRKYRKLFNCYFITARPRTHKSFMDTMRVLKKLDLLGFKDIYFMPKRSYDAKRDDYVLKYKFETRNKVCERENGSVLVRFGDMVWDIVSTSKNKKIDNLLDTQDCAIVFVPGLNGEVGVKLPHHN